MLKIQITKRVCKFLDRLQLKPTLQLKEKLQELRKNPLPQDSRILIGYPRYRRVTVGEYRIVYSVEKDTLLVFLIGKRNDSEVYRKLKRIL